MLSTYFRPHLRLTERPTAGCQEVDRPSGIIQALEVPNLLHAERDFGK